ncbi:MAG: 4-carboxymuconolactone decarboxylase [Betaproteobacteria bacterium]|nr:4-carboxymuconolactone decarboxylase [Betaproteobacteria bacterium]
MKDEDLARGKRLRQKVLGSKYAEGSLAGVRLVSAQLHELVIRYGWGEAWEGEHLDLKTRSLLMVAMLAALDRPKQLKVHIQGAINNGSNSGEITELLRHVAVVCGAPAALDAGAIADDVFAAQSAD